MIIWPKDTALALPVLMVDSADHVTGKTNLSVQIAISKNATTFVTTTVEVASIGLGLYRCSLTAGMLDTAGIMTVHAYAASADVADYQIQVMDLTVAMAGVRTVNMSANVITGGVLATDAITSGALSAGAVDKIQATLATTTQLNNISAVVNTMSQTLSTISGVVNALSGAVSTVSGVVNALSGAVSTVSSVVNTASATLSGLSASVSAIKAKTDQMTFSVSGSLDVNIEHVNDIEITGLGTTGTPWGPL